MSSRRVVFSTGVIAPVVYLVFTTVAFLKYPAEYSPITNWLSDLGNPLVNQSGALFYNLGCIITSLILIAFYLGLRELVNDSKRLKVLLTIAQITGILSSIFLIITALFPLGSHTAIHQISGKLHIIFLGFFLTFSATVLLRNPSLKKWPAYFGFITAVVNFVYGAFLYSVFFAEWIAIGMFIIFVLMISFYSILMVKEEVTQISKNKSPSKSVH
jgi:hypothetical membrane protein